MQSTAQLNAVHNTSILERKAPTGAFFTWLTVVPKSNHSKNMIFTWFDAQAANAFGRELADFYIQRSEKNCQNTRGKIVERKQRELLDKLSQKIDTFKISKPLNIYKRAQLGNAFKWRLLDAGLDKAQVNQLTSWVTRQL